MILEQDATFSKALIGKRGHPFPEAHSVVFKIENSIAKGCHHLVAFLHNTLTLRSDNSTIARAIHGIRVELMFLHIWPASVVHMWPALVIQVWPA